MEKLMLVPVDTPKVAVPKPLALPGTVAGFQFAAVLKSPEPGLASQVALCADACALKTTPRSRLAAANADRIFNFATPDYPKPTVASGGCRGASSNLLKSRLSCG